jgi:glycosyltransferase involved in cell wall biosynthesis
MRPHRLDQVLVSLSAWIRGQPWMRMLARRLPAAWRGQAAQRLHAATVERLRFADSAAWPSPALAAAPLPVRPPATDGGINLVGYLRGEFGLAEAARRYAGALVTEGYDVALRSVELALPHGWDDRSLESWISDHMPHAHTLLFVNPDYLPQVAGQLSLRRDAGHRVYACWFWELEVVPAHWQDAIDSVDGILVASRFVEKAIRARTDKPVLRVPLPLPTAPAPLAMGRADFGLEEGKFYFLSMFDFHSAIERKNPFAVIAAFRAAFPAHRDDVRLLIKTSNADAAPEPLARLIAAVGGDRRIIVRDQHLHRRHLRALQACCDAYVSLHRAEGFGLVMAEAMALGKPVIATAWSGNMDFMDRDNSLLIDYQLVPVPEGAYPDAQDAHWADPSVEAAAAAMASLANDLAKARMLGERARLSVLEQLSARRAAAQIHDWIVHPADAVQAHPPSAPYDHQASHP